MRQPGVPLPVPALSPVRSCGGEKGGGKGVMCVAGVTVTVCVQDEVKDVSTMFVGTSPEFELALFSMCFFAGEEVNAVRCGDYDLDIKAYRWNCSDGADKVATVFPIAK